ncbi:hypothetical protein OUZ56_005629 [Daphnia magna]|uniref:Uncharacterized protein n=1 Tax=Daphnia magna TaxID=35525 RepID=A0ABQ9YTA9_9CRUS|nr:hypothetical protein OUZ56_005629 [Daphnia magna]
MVGSTANPREATASKAQQDIGQADVAGPTTYDLFETQRTCKAIQGSRIAIQGFVKHAKSLLDIACKLQQQLIDVVGDATVAKQHDIHLNYVQQVGLVESDFKEYLDRKKSDPCKKASSFHGFSAAHGSQKPPLPHQDTPTQSSRRSASTTFAGQNNTKPDNERRESRVRKWVEEHQLCIQEDSAPDAWNDLYRDGRLHTTRQEFSGASSSIRSLSHPDATYSEGPGRKVGDTTEASVRRGVGRGLWTRRGRICKCRSFGPLKGELRKKRRHVRCLDASTGETQHLQQDPPPSEDLLRRPRIRDGGRDQKYMAEVALCRPVAMEHRSGGDLERRSLNEFSNWLCQRAMAYQKSYTIAAEQSKESQPRPKERFATKSHAANADSNRNLSRGKVATPFYCFKCES